MLKAPDLVFDWCLRGVLPLFRIGGRVQVDGGATWFVGVEHAERRRVNMDRHHVLLTDVRVSELVNVGDVGTGNGSGWILAGTLIFQTTRGIISEGCFPHGAFTDAHAAMRTIVIVNRRPLPRSPTQDQHLHKVVAADEVTPVVAFLETDVGFEFLGRHFGVLQPVVDLFERGRSRLRLDGFYQCRHVIDGVGNYAGSRCVGSVEVGGQAVGLPGNQLQIESARESLFPYRLP